MAFKTVPTPNYIITERYTHKDVTMEAGCFVRPISDQWVPKHVIEENLNRWPDTKYCMTPKCGIILIPTKILRRV